MAVMGDGAPPQVTVQAAGAGAIAIGGDAINSIFVTGGTSQFFVGQYERLADAYLDPRSLYRELELDGFTGRRWLLRELDDFVAAADRGYVVIEAAVGLGKTAFAAWLARERHLVHHFVRLMPDVDDIAVALRSLAAQLIRAWDLTARAVGGVLPPNAGRPDVFEVLLFEAAQKRDETRPGEPIIIVVDGLNETSAPPGHNPLALPAEVPLGVYFVVTQRPEHVALVVAAPRRVLTIEAHSDHNHDDVRAHLAAAATAPELSRSLAGAGITADDFVEALFERSDGVWLVLRYVLAELRSGVRGLDDLTSVPAGLWQYYASYWAAWQRDNPESWQAVDLPLLATLTALQEPQPLEVLCDFADCPDRARAEFLIDDAWRPFLQVHVQPDERYEAFHDSLGEFVAGDVPLGDLRSAERAFVRRLAKGKVAAHQRIADRYLDAWGGLEAGLPGLDGDTANVHAGYGLRHLVSHLIGAQADATLHRLLALERPCESAADEGVEPPVANTWYQAHRVHGTFASYALDLERAWARAEVADGDPTVSDDFDGLGFELGYAVAVSSLNSIVGNVPSELLEALVEAGLTTVDQALELARGIADVRARSEALVTLLPRLSGQAQEQAISDALASVQMIPDGYWQAGELMRLAAIAGSEHRDDLLRLADGMSRPYYREIVTKAIAGQGADDVASTRPASSLDPADPEVFAQQYRQRSRQAVATLTALGTTSVETTDAGQRVRATRFVRDPRWRAQLLTTSARQASGHMRDDMLRAALGISLTVGDERSMSSCLGSIGSILARRGDVDAALACLAGLRDPHGRARALFTIAAAASQESERPRIVLMALEAVMDMEREEDRGEVLRVNATSLVVVGDDRRVERALASLDDGWRACVRVAVARHAPAERRNELLQSALDSVLTEANVADRFRVVAELIPELPDALLEAAEAVIDRIDDKETGDRARALLAGRQARLGQIEVDRRTMGLVTEPYWEVEARLGVAGGLAARGQNGLAVEVASTIESPTHRAEGLAVAGDLAGARGVVDAAADPLTRIACLLRIGRIAARATNAPSGAHHSVDEARAMLEQLDDVAAYPAAAAAVAEALAAGGQCHSALGVIGPLADEDRAEALRRLAPYVTEGSVDDAIRAARSLSNPADRGRSLAGLTGVVARTRASTLPSHIRDTLHLSSTGTRSHLLEAATDLAPGLVALSGSPGIVALADAIALAYRWWP
jgi:hypothetical protein